MSYLYISKLKPQRSGQKIFCIGFIKTGTKSFAKAMKSLGYHHVSFSKDLYDHCQRGEYDALFHFISKFDSFDDIPFNEEKIIKLIDQKYPNSKFVYLDKNNEEWLKSFSAWSKKMTNNHIDVQQWHQRFIAHKKFVNSFFADRQKDKFISLNISDPLGFSKLAVFLNEDKPRKSNFPHVNSTSKL